MKNKFYIFGSENSQDYDIAVECDSIPDIDKAHNICKEYNKELSLLFSDKEINSNLIVIKDNIIIDQFKGVADELNNCIYYTYENHKQFFPKPILTPIERDINEKIVRVARFIITFYSRTELRKEIKAALRGNLLSKLEVLKKIDFVKMTEFPDKKEKKEDIYKVLAFQFGQVFSLIEGCEEDSYTKNGIIKNYSSFANLLNRGNVELEDLFNLNIYLWKYIQYVELNINNLRLEEKIKDI
jgi:hypothetical protein